MEVRPRRWVMGLVIGTLLVGAIAAGVLFLAVRQRLEPELARSVPQDLDVYAEIPRIDRLLLGIDTMNAFDPDKGDLQPAIDELALPIATSLGLPPSTVAALADHVTSAALGARLLRPREGSGDFEPILVLRLDDIAAVTPLLDSKQLSSPEELEGGERYDLPGGPIEAMGWFPSARLLLFGDVDIIDEVAEVLAGEQPSLEDSEAFRATRKKLPRSYVAYGFFDTRALRRVGERELQEKLFRDTAPLTATVTLGEAGLRLDVEAPTSGPWALDPNLAGAPGALTLTERLPAESLAYLAFRTEVAVSGEEFEDAILDGYRERDADAGKRLKRLKRDAEREVGLKLREVIDATGEQGVVAVMLAPTYRPTAPPRFPTDLGFAYVQHLGIEDDAKRLLRYAERTYLDDEKRFDVVWDDDKLGFVATPADPGKAPFVRARLQDDHLFAAAGPEALNDRFWQAFQRNGNRLSEDAAHAAAIDALDEGHRIRAWVDTGRLLADVIKANPRLHAQASDLGLPPDTVLQSGPQRLTSAAGMGWSGAESTWTFRADGLNVLWPAVPVMHFERIQSLRKQATKEAREAVVAIAAAAQTAFLDSRREILVPATDEEDAHYEKRQRLCKSAGAVPAEVPRRHRYEPSVEAGTDFRGGDTDRGWVCVGYRPKKPSLFRLGYVAGGPYLTVERGGPNPGPDGFEATAEGDLDGDGKTSFFSVTGKIDPKTGDLVLNPGVFSDDELE